VIRSLVRFSRPLILAGSMSLAAARAIAVEQLPAADEDSARVERVERKIEAVKHEGRPNPDADGSRKESKSSGKSANPNPTDIAPDPG